MTMVNSSGLGLAFTPPDVAAEQLESAPSPGAPRAKRFAWSRILGPTIVFVVFIAVWHWMHTNGMRALFDRPGFLIPAPETVIHDSFVDPVARSALLNGIKWTAYIALIGLAITIVVGMILAVVMAQARSVENSIYPYLVAIQAIPILAIVPVIYSMFGGGLIPRVLVCVLISIFPIVTNTLFGLQSADSGQHDLFTLRGANRFTRLVKLQLPAAMPNIFTGFRISAGLSVIGAVVGEQFFRAGSKPGIGIVLESYRQKGIYPQVFGCLILAAGLGIVVFLLFGWLAKAVVGHWHESGRVTR
jgi:NitT/TauT family transport system permease protein